MSEREFLEAVLLDHQSAVELCLMMGFVCQVWDDLIDGDPRTASDVNKAFLMAVCDANQNDFFIEHRAELVPMIRMAIFDWMDATSLERSTKRYANDLAISYVLRDSMIGLVVQMARLIGGVDHALQVGPSIRRFFFDETLEQYTASQEATT